MNNQGCGAVMDKINSIDSGLKRAANCICLCNPLFVMFKPHYFLTAVFVSRFMLPVLHDSNISYSNSWEDSEPNQTFTLQNL